MPLQYACFISYRHSPNEEVRQLIAQLEQELSAQLALSMTEQPYWDKDLEYGELYRKSLPVKLCQSVCMVVVYGPVYSESDFCRGEFLVMSSLQQKRFQKLGDLADQTAGMIIPIIVKRHPKDRTHAQEWLPEEIEKLANYCDISKYVLVSARKMRNNSNFRKEMQKVADHIARVGAMLKPHADLCADCDGFEIPETVPPWRSAAPPPFPLR